MKHHQNIARDIADCRRAGLISDMPEWEEKTPEQEEQDSLRMLGWVMTAAIVFLIAAVVVLCAP